MRFFSSKLSLSVERSIDVCALLWNIVLCMASRQSKGKFPLLYSQQCHFFVHTPFYASVCGCVCAYRIAKVTPKSMLEEGALDLVIWALPVI